MGGYVAILNQLCTLTPDFDARVSGFSPDRADALVWAIADLIALDHAQPLLDFYKQSLKTTL
jgi:phage terminase large subunit-like protein